MDPKHLFQLAVILDKGTVTAAAQHLLLTQPTLTRNMATLEMQAGAPLFERSRYGVRSTPLGESLARTGRAIGRQLLEAKETISRHKIGFNTHLKVGVGPLIGMALMPQLSHQFLSANPNISLSVMTGRPVAIIDQLIDGDLDIALAPAVYAQMPRGIHRELLCEDVISVFCSVNHPLARKRKRKRTADDFSQCEWVNVGTTSPFQNAELDMLERSGIHRIRTRFATVSDAIILLQVLMTGQHLAVLPRLPIKLLRDRIKLVEITPPAGTADRHLYLWSRQDLTQDPAFKALRHTAFSILDQLDKQ